MGQDSYLGIQFKRQIIMEIVVTLSELVAIIISAIILIAIGIMWLKSKIEK
jgi:hypothetical protein